MTQVDDKVVYIQLAKAEWNLEIAEKLLVLGFPVEKVAGVLELTTEELAPLVAIAKQKRYDASIFRATRKLLSIDVSTECLLRCLSASVPVAGGHCSARNCATNANESELARSNYFAST